MTLTTNQLSKIFLPLSFGKRSGQSASMYEIINSYLKLFPSNRVVVNSSAPTPTITIGNGANNGDTDGEVAIVGNKFAGQINLTTGAVTGAGTLCTVELADPTLTEDHHYLLIQLTPANENALNAMPYIYVNDADWNHGAFTLTATDAVTAESNMLFNYTVHTLLT